MFNLLSIVVLGMSNFVSKHFIDDMCVVVVVPASTTMKGVTFHSFVMMLLMSHFCSLLGEGFYT